MGCGCGKKRGPTIHFMGHGNNHEADPEEWGPILWKYMHCLIQRIGHSGNTIMDTDQAMYLEYMLHNLGNILPCQECQGHAVRYISQNPPPVLKGQYGVNLRRTAQTWLFTFHNSVRSMKNQPILVNSLEQLESEYADCFIAQCEFSLLSDSVAYGVRHGWVRVDIWRKWYSNSEKMRALISSPVVR